MFKYKIKSIFTINQLEHLLKYLTQLYKLEILFKIC